MSDDYPSHPLNDRLTDAAADWQTLDGVAPSTFVGVLVGILGSAVPGELASWLEHHKLAVHADLWAVPVDPGEDLARLAALPDTDDEAELDRRLDEEGLLREALTRVGHVYLEGEPRPSCAPTLYEIGGGA